MLTPVHLRVEARRIEQPGQVAQHRLSQLPLRHDALLRGSSFWSGVVVGQPVEQRRLQPLFGAADQAWSASAATSGVDPRTQRDRAHVEQRRFAGVGGEETLPESVVGVGGE